MNQGALQPWNLCRANT